MPLNIAKADRQLLIWAVAFLLLLMLVLAVLSTGEKDTGIPSTYSAQSSGAKAAYLLLHDLGYDVERWEQSPSELPTEAMAATTLVLASPEVPPSQEEKAFLQLYLARGGRILITGRLAGLYLNDTQLEPEIAPEPLPRAYRPQIVSALARSGMISMSPLAYWRDCATSCLAHYSDNGRPIVVSYPVGAGEVIWWASSEPLSNAGLAKDGNLALLLNSVGPAGQTRVLWDEYFHGARRTAASYVLEWPVLAALAQLALLALAILFTYSRRNGPVYPSDEPSRLSPLEFVETLGGLYRRAHAVRTAVEVPYHRFRMQAIRQLGLKTDIGASDLAHALSRRLGHSQDELQELLQRIEAALYDPELGEAEALKLVQELDSHARRLHMVSHARQEISSHAGSLAGAYSRKN